MEKTIALLAVAVTALCVGNLLHIIGLSTPNWCVVDDGEHYGSYGLWEVCGDGKCFEFVHNKDYPDWIKACEAMSILGMLSGLASLVPAIIALVMAAMKKLSLPILGKISIATAFASFCMILICVIIFAAEKNKKIGTDCDYGYSFGLSITGALLILPGGILPIFTTRTVY
ncbi:epithelial membrane protein 2 [Plakobranchus ocellatus]|uniref:Epithelial membrane protein 2 n=1 Tax=Plakobranchus ocellatus TaxID=259542 RepID=A0AAV4DXG0_9GAST|nr:epithelial membrane protein 2 [Plakobranchus ocellatus]